MTQLIQRRFARFGSETPNSNDPRLLRVDHTDTRSVTYFGLDDGVIRLRADRSGRSCESYPSDPSVRNQPATRRARVCSPSSTGVTPKSRLNSRLNCDALSYPTALAAVLAL